MSTIDLSAVHHVYSGKDGKCCCGCSGTHRYLAAYREEESKRRGYAIDDDELNDRQVKKVCDLLQSAAEQGTSVVHDEGDHVWTVVGSRIYIAYRS